MSVEYPRVPGHEVIGRIDAVGDGVEGWNVDERVGVGWFGGQDNRCPFCRHGDFVNCENQPVTGLDVDGGYAEMLIARETGLVRVPDDMDPVASAPLMCAGLTTFSGRHRHEPLTGLPRQRKRNERRVARRRSGSCTPDAKEVLT